MTWKDYYTAITGRSAPSEQASSSGTVYGTTPSRTSAVEDYYNEQMQQKQATEKARDIIDGRGRGHVGGLRDAWLDKNGERALPQPISQARRRLDCTAFRTILLTTPLKSLTASRRQ